VDRIVYTPDGRVLAVEDADDPAGRPVLVHNDTPMSRRLYGPNVADAAERGLRLISYDRPGYGGSTPQPGRAVADCAADVRAICAGLGIGKLAIHAGPSWPSGPQARSQFRAVRGSDGGAGRQERGGATSAAAAAARTGCFWAAATACS